MRPILACRRDTCIYSVLFETTAIRLSDIIPAAAVVCDSPVDVQKKRVCLALAAVVAICIVVFLAVEAGEAGEAVSCTCQT